MNNNSLNSGLYKHFERPEQGQIQQSKSKKAHHFVRQVIGLVIVVLVDVPVYLTFNHESSSSDMATPTRVKTSALNSVSSKGEKIKIVKESSSFNSASSELPFSSQAVSSDSVASSSSSELRTYVVQNGGSLSSTTAAHEISVDTLTRSNSITDTTSVRVGETLKLN